MGKKYLEGLPFEEYSWLYKMGMIETVHIRDIITYYRGHYCPQWDTTPIDLDYIRNTPIMKKFWWRQ